MKLLNKKIEKDNLIILKNLSFLTILRVFNVGAKFILVAYLIRVLGKINYGVLTWVDSIIQYFLIIINFGFNIYAAKYIVDNKNSKEGLNKICSAIFTVKMSLFVVSILMLLFLCNFSVFGAQKELLFLMILIGLGDVFFPLWYFQGIEKLKLATYITVFSRILLVLGTFLFVENEFDIKTYVTLLVASNLVMGLMGYYVLVKNYNFKFVRINFNYFIQKIKEAHLFFLGTFLSLSFNLLPIFLIGVYYTMDYVSGFDIALKIVLVCIIPFDMLQQAIYPTIVRTKNKKNLKKFITVSIVFGLILSTILFFFSEWLLLLFGGDEMIIYSDVLKNLALIPAFVAVTFMLGTCTLVAFGFQKEFNNSLIIASLIFMLLLIVMFFLDIITFWNLVYLRLFADFILMLLRVFYVVKNKVLIC